MKLKLDWKHGWPAVAIFFGILLITLISLVIKSESRPYEVRIFANIEECEKITALANDEVTVEVLESNETDKKAKNLSYEAFYGAKYKSKKVEFVLYAYQFTNRENAEQYFKNCSGDKPFASAGVWGKNGKLAAICDNRVYYLKSRGMDTDVARDILNPLFSQQILYSAPWFGATRINA